MVRTSKSVAIVVVAVTVVQLSFLAGVGAQAPECGSGYRPPVQAPVVDGFREEGGRFGPGNRGLEYGLAKTASITAIASGEVLFAGRVAGRGVVTLLHEDGLRSSYTGLQEIQVRVDDRLAGCADVGRASVSLHLSVRAGSAYLDPAVLFAEAARPTPFRVRLVSTRQERERPESVDEPRLMRWPGPELEDSSRVPL